MNFLKKIFASYYSQDIRPKKVFFQLWMELWPSLIIAGIYTPFAVHFTYISKNDGSLGFFIIETFFKIFLFAGIFTGHYIRVNKQLKVDHNFKKAENTMVTLSEKLEAQTTLLTDKTNNLLNVITGGESFFYYQLGQHLSAGYWFLLSVVYNGEFPLSNVRISFPFEDSNFKDHQWSFPNISPQVTSRATGEIKLKFKDGGDEGNTSIVFGANNKTWVQIIHYYKRDNQVTVSTKVQNVSGAILKEETYKVALIDWPDESVF